MPERNEDQSFLRDVERNAKGQFQSRAKQQDILKQKTAELNAQLQKQTALIQKLQTRQAKAPKLDKTIAKGMKAQVQLLKQQTKGAANALKSYEKMQKSTLKIQQRLLKSRQQAQRAMPAHAGGKGGGFLSGGFGLNLPTFLSAAAIIAATKAMIGYVTELGRARDYARALGGRLPELPYRRDQELYSKFAVQNFGNRFSSPQEISGLKNLRDSLTQALGPDLGEEITLKLTNALKDSQAELQKFLTLASRNVPEALKVFESADIENFATALKAVTQQTDEWSKAASNLEQLWIDIQQIGESLAGIVAPIFGDIAAKLREGTKEGSQFRTMLIDAAEGGVRGIYKLIDSIKEAYADLLDMKIGWQELKVAYLDFVTASGRKSSSLGTAQEYQAAVKELEDMATKWGAIKNSVGKSQAQVRDLDKYFKELRERAAEIPVDDTATDMAKVNQEAQKARQELEKAATPAERMALAVKRLGENLEIADAELKVVKSALAAAESSPFGFAEAFEKRFELARKINERIAILRQQLEEIQAIENQTRADRLKALDIESQINDAIAERNQLLQQQQRGYLDAVQAQAFAAGRFEKIITTQDQNVAMALERGIAKKNPFIGQVGKDAEKSAVEPFRFGTDMAANIQGLNEYSKALRLNVADPIVQELQRLNQNLILPANPVQRDTDLQGANRARSGNAVGRSSPTVTAGSKGGIETMRAATKMLLDGLDRLEDDLAAERDVEDVVPVGARHAGVRGGSVLRGAPS